MVYFNNIKNLLKYVESNISINLEQLGNEIKNVLRNNVRTLFYERNGLNWTPSHYTRTWELIDCITVSKAKKVGKEYQVFIYFDTDKINPYPAENGMWSQHESIIDGQDISDSLPFYMEFGNNSPIYEYQGTYPVHETIDWIKEDNYIKTRLIELLESKGFKCEK